VRNQLGEFLRERRKALGLRREDVSGGAAIGYDWYVRIEQGRGHASVDVLGRIAETLKLDRTELNYVLALAQETRPANGISPTGAIPPSVVRVMHAQEPSPAYIVNTRLDLLAWNGAAAEFYGVEFAELPVEQRNVLWLMLTNDVMRKRIVESERHARRLVLQCRALWAGRLTDPAVIALVDALQDVSEPFRQWWTEPMTHVLDLGPVHKVVNDAEHGGIAIEQTAWQFGDKSDYILILSSPLDDAGRDMMNRLAALHTRRQARRSESDRERS
jgi:transcriptional regulator with XRE-family HTH domain